MLTLREGNVIVKTARGAVEFRLSGRKFHPPLKTSPGLEKQRGVFVSLVDQLIGGGLRGCIGIPLATRPLLEQVKVAAVETAEAVSDLAGRMGGVEAIVEIVRELAVSSGF